MKQRIFALALSLGLAGIGLKAADRVTFYTDRNQAVASDEIEVIVAADNLETFNVVLSDGTTIASVAFLTTEYVTGIETVANDGDPQVLVASDELRLSNCRSGKVAIFSTGGTMVAQQDIAGKGVINISHLAPGVYVLQVGKSTMKFVKH